MRSNPSAAADSRLGSAPWVRCSDYRNLIPYPREHAAQAPVIVDRWPATDRTMDSAKLAPVRVLTTRLKGPLLIAPVVFGDDRGFFLEAFRRNAFADLGIEDEFVQHNHSRSGRGVVRGMHFQTAMAKLVRCVRGSILDVLVDIRRGSPSFGQWESFELNDQSHRMLYCPEGFAHGFCVTSDVADVIYACTTYYDPDAEGGFSYEDPEVGIHWPRGLEVVASPRDASAPRLSQIVDELPFRFFESNL